MEDHADPAREDTLRVPALLRATSYLQRAVRVAVEGTVRGQVADREVEETRVREAVLFAVHPGPHRVHLQGTACTARGGSASTRW